MRVTADKMTIFLIDGGSKKDSRCSQSNVEGDRMDGGAGFITLSALLVSAKFGCTVSVCVCVWYIIAKLCSHFLTTPPEARATVRCLSIYLWQTSAGSGKMNHFCR